MDGGSTDETISILREYGERIRWVSEKDKGQTDAINKGLRVASGSIIAYLNSDDLYLAHSIRQAVDVFIADPETDFVYGDFHAIGEDGSLIDKIKTIPFDRDILLYDANFICQPASFYRRRLIDEIGYFDENLHYLMDYEFFLRAAKRRVRFHMIPAYLAAIRYHGQCKTQQNGVYPWKDERAKIKYMYARSKARAASAIKLLGIVYRLKRYFRLILRGKIDFMNIFLSYKLRRITSHAKTV